MAVSAQAYDSPIINQFQQENCPESSPESCCMLGNIADLE